MFCLMPVFALYLKLLYLGSGRRYGEHMLFALHTNAFAFLLLGLIWVVPSGMDRQRAVRLAGGLPAVGHAPRVRRQPRRHRRALDRADGWRTWRPSRPPSWSAPCSPPPSCSDAGMRPRRALYLRKMRAGVPLQLCMHTVTPTARAGQFWVNLLRVAPTNRRDFYARHACTAKNHRARGPAQHRRHREAGRRHRRLPAGRRLPRGVRGRNRGPPGHARHRGDERGADRRSGQRRHRDGRRRHHARHRAPAGAVRRAADRHQPGPARLHDRHPDRAHDPGARRDPERQVRGAKSAPCSKGA